MSRPIVTTSKPFIKMPLNDYCFENGETSPDLKNFKLDATLKDKKGRICIEHRHARHFK